MNLVNAFPSQNKKKGADGGIDGLKYFHDLPERSEAMMAVRTKEAADFAFLISLDEPTAKMKAEATTAGLYGWHAAQKKSPRVQLLSVEGLMSAAQRAEHPDYQPNVTFKKAKRETRADGPGLFGDAE